MRGASEFEPGASGVCPQGIPIYHFADNEAHNMGKYGLRIFTGLSPHNGEGMPGFYPKSDPCAPVSATNPFKTARFVRQYSWRNTRNGITVGSVAAVHIIDAVVADNNMVGVEMLGATGVKFGLTTPSKLRGPWGSNKLIGTVFIGHPLPPPGHARPDHLWRPFFPQKRGNPKSQRWGDARLGVVCPTWRGLTVENATFINYDRPGMIAVGGYPQALPDPAVGYAFGNMGGYETRFSGITWLQSNYRVKWRWNDEAVYTDLDGTFADQPFCGAPRGQAHGCHVLSNGLVTNFKSFPNCYHDARYDGPVCKPDYNVVEFGFSPKDPLMLIKVRCCSFHPLF